MDEFLDDVQVKKKLKLRIWGYAQCIGMEAQDSGMKAQCDRVIFFMAGTKTHHLMKIQITLISAGEVAKVYTVTWIEE